MRFRLKAFVCLALWTAAVPFAGAQQPQVPFLSVTTLQSGNTIARSVRTMEKGATQLSKEVSRAGACREGPAMLDKLAAEAKFVE
jgi:hypothetical protein